jgi:hypothetical protein
MLGWYEGSPGGVDEYTVMEHPEINNHILVERDAPLVVDDHALRAISSSMVDRGLTGYERAKAIKRARDQLVERLLERQARAASKFLT